MLSNIFRSIVWTSRQQREAKPLASSVWREERIARFKAGIEELRRAERAAGERQECRR